MDTTLSAPQWAPTPTQTPPTTSKYLFRPTVVTSTAASSLSSPVVLALHCPAGTGATVYNGWVAAFKAAFLEDPDPVAGAVHLVPIELPGRGLRTKETLRTNMEDLASEIAAALEGYVASISSSTVDSAAVVPPRLCVLGHSLGGWIGFEVFRKLRHRALSCCCLIASGIRSPTLCGVDNDIDGTAMHELDEAAFWEAMVGIGISYLVSRISYLVSRISYLDRRPAYDSRAPWLSHSRRASCFVRASFDRSVDTA